MDQAPTSSRSDEQIEVPAAAFVQCPLVGFELAPVASCTACEKFGGLEDRFPDSRMSFAKRYTLKCYGEAVRRPMLMLATKG